MTDFEETPQRDLMLIGDCGCGSPTITYLSALEATHMERTLYIFVILNKQHLQIPDRTPLSALSDLICPSIGVVCVCVCVCVCMRVCDEGIRGRKLARLNNKKSTDARRAHLFIN